jgi:beta-glucosidase
MFDGVGTIQLYLRDLVGSVVRPVKELKGLQKIFVIKDESRLLMLSAADLKFITTS